VRPTVPAAAHWRPSTAVLPTELSPPIPRRRAALGARCDGGRCADPRRCQTGLPANVRVVSDCFRFRLADIASQSGTIDSADARWRRRRRSASPASSPCFNDPDIDGCLHCKRLFALAPTPTRPVIRADVRPDRNTRGNANPAGGKRGPMMAATSQRSPRSVQNSAALSMRCCGRLAPRWSDRI